MAIAAGTSIEHPRLNLGPSNRGVQVNIEINRRCSLTSACRERCLLIATGPKTQEMPPALRMQAIKEVLDAGPGVRHLSLVGMEPTESPVVLKDVLREYHRRDLQCRPEALGMISNGLRLHELDFLASWRLSWLLVSIDGLPQTHRRGWKLWKPAFMGLMHVQRTKGALVCGVNSVLDGDNTEAVIALGRMLIDNGLLYQGVGTYMTAADGQMVSEVSAQRTREIYEQLALAFPADSEMTVMFEMDAEAFQLVAGYDPHCVVGGPWRLEHRQPGTSVVAATMNSEPGRFLRLRYDSQIIDKADLLTIGLVEGRYGAYEPGKLARLIDASHKATIAAIPGNRALTDVQVMA